MACNRDFLFCSLCGNLLSLNSPRVASCETCGFKRNAREIIGREIRYSITAEDIIRELNMEPILSRETDRESEKVNRAVVNERCPQCNHPQLEYYTKQLRSADEGQTIFYECPSCFHKFSQNT
ncbi:DNA-directed RNA polymerase subunit/transcription factor S protein [Dioscorea alata]|uniref:DNA-directed RNA polymerase subunit n=2 Tax=Dioscorea TaxID=4672 RepID=A0AB40D3V4_DIOCR|nr:DNA-directed RNA polymerase I subunit RPA12 [Dioscorea cayenensis subsp. rotundata]KAH7652885.1 DNA-directed RNA polymerase subunit/transcription factor S protein [Dioscorea alata]